jgi:hypothetical protein
MVDLEAPAQLTSEGQPNSHLVKEQSAGQLATYLRLYKYGDATDFVAICLGVAGALLNAPTMPLFAYVFGEVCYVNVMG